MRAHHGYCGRVMPVSVSGEGGSLKTWMCDPIYSVWWVSPWRLWTCGPRSKLWEGFMLEPVDLRHQV